MFFCIRRLFTFLCALVFFQATAKADWYTGRAEEYFGPETAEKSACRVAESKAVSAAVQGAIGESISTTKLQICHEAGRTKPAQSDACQLMSTAIIAAEGTVVGIRNRAAEVFASAGNRVCRVSLEVDIRKETGIPDTGFDPEIRLKQAHYRHGDPARIVVNTSQPFYLSLFVLSPYLEEHEQVQKIYPNEFEQMNRIEGSTELPGLSAGYEITAQFPNLDIGSEQAGEILIAVATKSEKSFRNRFSVTEFNSRIQEIPRNERRITRIPYFIFSRKNDFQ